MLELFYRSCAFAFTHRIDQVARTQSYTRPRAGNQERIVGHTPDTRYTEHSPSMRMHEASRPALRLWRLLGFAHAIALLLRLCLLVCAWYCSRAVFPFSPAARGVALAVVFTRLSRR